MSERSAADVVALHPVIAVTGRAALAWAEALTNVRESRAPDEVYEQAHVTFSEKELADLSITIAMINAWNRLAIGARAAHPSDRLRPNAAGWSAERVTS